MELASVILLQAIVLIYCEGNTFQHIHISGERYIGPIIRFFGTMGQRQCINECLTRPTVCKGVNYKKIHLLCEIVSSIDKTEYSGDYIRVPLNQHTVNRTECLSCSHGEKCITLLSNKTYCIKENYDPQDCITILGLSPYLPSGLYRIRIPALGHVTVFCEMEADGGGWTVFQRRMDGSEDFNRTWNEYRNGFGKQTGEFWLGNEKLSRLLSQGSYEMRMDMGDFDNQTRYIKYSSMTLGDEASKYAISLSGYSGDVADCFTIGTSATRINNTKFTTMDQDNDLRSGGNCAILFKSGWWHNSCHCSNPNGLYLAGNTTIYAQGIVYRPWRTYFYSLKFMQLMVRRVG
ncbi:ficolin-2-like [Saccostrea echinata]|uniref:ficolin-2-like n=1 Tax=Saccostrea echinata TaxID=191078 RepID=UPI002A82089D|nr:ficolin-2-like [Saccostrea echinata]